MDGFMKCEISEGNHYISGNFIFDIKSVILISSNVVQPLSSFQAVNNITTTNNDKHSGGKNNNRD